MTIQKTIAKTSREGKHKAGFTLAEVMIGLFVFGLICLGLLSSILQTRRITEGSIFQSTATTIAQGYLSQLMEMNYDNFDSSEIGNIITQDAEETLILSTAGNLRLNERLIDMKNTSDNTDDDMRMDLYVFIDNVDDSTIGISGAKMITVDYTYHYNGSTYSNTVKSIRSNVTSK